VSNDGVPVSCESDEALLFPCSQPEPIMIKVHNRGSRIRTGILEILSIVIL
jgi:hypothetical protein